MAKEVKIEFSSNAKVEVLFDVNALEQIVSNLLNNIEKYAHSRKFANIHARQQTKGLLWKYQIEDQEFEENFGKRSLRHLNDRRRYQCCHPLLFTPFTAPGICMNN
ncbi:hypothetical protein KKA14_11645 [bacterium]|nr:hypothetical protein [bacterium]